MSLLVISEILGLFVNTLSSYVKYSLCNSENLWQPIQMLLAKKQKTYFEFFAPFLKSTSNCEYFEKKHDPQSLCFSEITHCERAA